VLRCYSHYNTVPHTRAYAETTVGVTLTTRPGLALLDDLVDADACSERRCRYGAMCQLTNGVAECVCPATCEDIGDPSVLDGDGSLVCGSDSRTYGSACQLVLFACRLQRDIKVAYYGPCQGTTTHVRLLHHIDSRKYSTQAYSNIRIRLPYSVITHTNMSCIRLILIIY